MDKHIQMEYNKITDHIYLGTNMCCDVHFSRLLDLGVSADISLEEEVFEKPRNLQAYLWLPVVDRTPPTLEQLDIGVHAIDRMLNNNFKIYIHCKNGHGRSPTLLIAYFIWKGLSYKDAYNKVYLQRKEIHLEKSQELRLYEFMQKIRA